MMMMMMMMHATNGVAIRGDTEARAPYWSFHVHFSSSFTFPLKILLSS